MRISEWSSDVCSSDLRTGTKAVVAHGEAADNVLVSARVSGTEGDQTGMGLFLVKRNAPGLSIQGYPLIDGGRAGDLHLVDTPSTLVSEAAYSVIEDVVAAGIVALSWEAVGIMDVTRMQSEERGVGEECGRTCKSRG